VWGPKRTLAAFAFVALGFAPLADAAAEQKGSSHDGGRHSRHQAQTAQPGRPGSRVKHYKLDKEVERRKKQPLGTSSVIVTLQPGAELPAEFRRFARGGRLNLINGQVLDLPNSVIRQLEARPEIFQVHYNRPIGRQNYRTNVTIGTPSVRSYYGYTGRGIGIAVIDSGIASWHDDLTSRGSTVYPYGNQRVAKFVDFVNGHAQPYDDNGHGTHVSGIIAGNGWDTYGLRAGVAPDANLVSLKVLDANGVGTIGNIIAALGWIAENHQAYNVRVVNMSVGAKVLESYWTDPLTLAAKAVVDKGIVVVTAAGNLGRNAQGELQYGGIAAPANAPWVLTVGASNTEGTLWRSDDTMAGFSSAGPTFIDFSAKPDLVAPGTGIVSLSSPGSAFYFGKQANLVSGFVSLGYMPYLTLSGTSMAAPAVAGTVALMLQANPTLTPNLVKAILQYTAQQYPGYDALRQGAGFLNAFGAVRLARFYASNQPGSTMPVQSSWSRRIIWGNHRLGGGYINPLANAWAPQVVWGAARGLDDDNIVWGTICGDSCDNIVWGTMDASGDNIVWGTSYDDNIVWGTMFYDDNIVWGTSYDDNIVWGTTDDNIVWGTDCGGADCDNIVWGTSDDDNIVWGTADDDDNIVWGTSDDDNIVWGTNDDNIVWGTDDDNIVWGTSSADEIMFPAEDPQEPVPPPAELGDVSGGGR
jgi:subtilisin family serine protease